MQENNQPAGTSVVELAWWAGQLQSVDGLDAWQRSWAWCCMALRISTKWALDSWGPCTTPTGTQGARSEKRPMASD